MAGAHSSESQDAKPRPSRWWVRFVHPLRWGFWIISLPLLVTGALGSLLCSPWFPECDFEHSFSPSWKLQAYRRHYSGAGDERVAVSIALGSLRLGRSRCACGHRMVPGWRSFYQPSSNVTCWQYGWGGTVSQADEGIYFWVRP